MTVPKLLGFVLLNVVITYLACLLVDIIMVASIKGSAEFVFGFSLIVLVSIVTASIFLAIIQYCNKKVGFGSLLIAYFLPSLPVFVIIAVSCCSQGEASIGCDIYPLTYIPQLLLSFAVLSALIRYQRE